MKVKKPVLENPVYCDILYAIGNQEITLTELNDSFKKSFQVLWRQLEYLSDTKSFKKKDKSSPYYMRDKEPFLNKESIAENNKQLYSINWPKLIDCLMGMIKHKHKQYSVLRIERREFKLLNNERFLRDIRHNKYLQGLFKGFVLSCEPKDNLLLIDFFNEIFSYPPLLTKPYLEVKAMLELTPLKNKNRKELQKQNKEFWDRFDRVIQAIEQNDKDLKDYISLARLINVVSVRPDLYYNINLIQKEIKKEILRNVPEEVKDIIEGNNPK